MITPPLGMNVFVIRSVASQYASLADVFRGRLRAEQALDALMAQEVS